MDRSPRGYEQLSELSGLAEALAAQLESVQPGWQQLRVDLPVALALPLFWAQSQGVRLAWRGRGEQTLILAWGQAQEYHARRAKEIPACLQQLRQELASAPAEIRAYGGLAFPGGSGALDSPWQEMGALRLVVPRFEIQLQGASACLNFHLCASGRPKQDQELLWQEFKTLAPPLKQPLTALPALSPCGEQPDYPAWEQQIQAVKQALSGQGLKKMVLARISLWQAEQAVSAAALLQTMLMAPPSTYLYFFHWPEQTLFAGLSPERLYARQARQIQTEALAGTRRTRVTAPRPQEPGDELLHSAKDRHEHQLVREFLEARLGPWCGDSLQTGPLQLVSSGPVQHLYQELRGELQADVSDFELLQALHPTPAVAGLPQQQALEMLTAIQNLERGWYSGPVGWINAQGAEFSVALRCLLAQNEQVRFLTGAGIVPGSEALREWEELNAKQETLLQFFEHQQPPRSNPQALRLVGTNLGVLDW